MNMMLGISLAATNANSGGAAPTVIYYVDPAGSDAANGLSPATAWQTLGKVNGATIPAGASVLFKGGSTFTGQLTLTAGKHFGSSGLVTTFGSYGTGNAIIEAGVNGDCGVYAINPQYVTIRDLDLRGTGTLVSTSSGVYFENTLTGGVYLRGVSIIGNTVSGYGLDGISGWGNPADTSGSGFDGTTITDNIVHDCTGNATAYRGCGITLQSLTTFGLAAVQPTILNAYIASNTVYNCIGKSKATIGSHSGNGILLGQSQDCLIEYNYVHHNGGTGGSLVAIWCYDSQRITVQFNEAAFTTVEAGTSDGGGFDVDGGCKDCIFQYNYSHDNAGAGFQLYDYSGSASFGELPLQGNKIRYNISENDGGANGATSGKGCLFIGNDDATRDATGNAIHNNVFYSSLAGAVAVIFAGAAHNKVKSSYIANNVFYLTGASSKFIYTFNVTPDATMLCIGNCYSSPATSIKWGPTTYTTFANWRAAFPAQETVAGGATFKAANPSLVGTVPVGTIGGFNPLLLGAYKTQAASVCKNGGQDLNALYGINMGSRDLFGNTIPQGLYDIGCYETA
ncbi:right-handed parallel beta-helix repeat-containing protein [Rhizobium ruizarguesonis]|uniref:right-handed parallel beta-helix repeat-containing protein n=1 Tax=Rhizobium ruizarguesonis TaxID=2081791 RepID=UPI00102F764D|nr:right-handed parallel beta-helix repeat-containing protein [Rhizobium ruizarguesonis]TBA65333.1 hypothetical protein ELH57_17260 [Rhizobium ruizarguesonis]